ncbi:MAG: bifunctional diaminohydroxyphosphoribosylaminopyrimidine deaminase/5-amino-6-(5-phosphoribosylamino)uracil reductase RibD [Myxococcaceae bacterium]
MNDAAAMALALAEATKGIGRTHPNPTVGAVLVKGGAVIGRGFTSPPGGPHAEINALREAGAKAKGATLYCTLEPCDHFGRTGPCSVAIIEAGVKRVVFAINDPNPAVNGKGERRLRKAGLAVTKGVLREGAEAMNRPFLNWVRTGLPWVTLKAGITLDGKLATATGRSKWITSEASRAMAHRLRNVVDAIVVGRGTVEADDPQLTTRIRGGRNALRVVIDPRLQSNPRRAIFDVREAPTLVLTEASPDSKGARALVKRGVEIASLEGLSRDLRPALKLLAARGAIHVLVEGGAETHRRFLSQDLADELVLFVAPKLFGHEGLTWSGVLGVKDPGAALQFGPLEATALGGDVMLRCSRVR